MTDLRLPQMDKFVTLARVSLLLHDLPATSEVVNLAYQIAAMLPPSGTELRREVFAAAHAQRKAASPEAPGPSPEAPYPETITAEIPYALADDVAAVLAAKRDELGGGAARLAYEDAKKMEGDDLTDALHLAAVWAKKSRLYDQAARSVREAGRARTKDVMRRFEREGF